MIFNILDFPNPYQSLFKGLLQTINKFIIKQTQKPDRSIIAKKGNGNQEKPIHLTPWDT